MFVYRHYKYKDICNDEYSGFEVGYNVLDIEPTTQKVIQYFERVKTFTTEREAAEYCHWLNGGHSYKYDNIGTEN